MHVYAYRHLSTYRVHSFDQILKSLRAAGLRERSVVKAFVIKCRICVGGVEWGGLCVWKGELLKPAGDKSTRQLDMRKSSKFSWGLFTWCLIVERRTPTFCDERRTGLWDRHPNGNTCLKGSKEPADIRRRHHPQLAGRATVFCYRCASEYLDCYGWKGAPPVGICGT